MTKPEIRIKPESRNLPLQRGLLRITGDTLEGPRETDSFDIVSGPGGRQILVDDPSGNPIEIFQPAD